MMILIPKNNGTAFVHLFPLKFYFCRTYGCSICLVKNSNWSERVYSITMHSIQFADKPQSEVIDFRNDSRDT